MSHEILGAASANDPVFLGRLLAPLRCWLRLSGNERFQECNVREDYRQTAFGGHQQKMNCGLPLGVVLGLGQGLNVTPSVEKRSQPPAVRWFDRLLELA
jgi:hypothetical protein